MTKTFRADIPQNENTPPCFLVFMFVDGKYWNRIALCRPAAYRKNDCFPFGFRLDVEIETKVELFMNGDWTLAYLSSDDAPLIEQAYIEDDEYSLVHRRELSQDLRACFPDAENYETLKPYLLPPL